MKHKYSAVGRKIRRKWEEGCGVLRLKGEKIRQTNREKKKEWEREKESRNGKNREEKDTAVIERKERKGTLCARRFGAGSRARPHTKSTRKKKIGPRCGRGSHRAEWLILSAVRLSMRSRMNVNERWLLSLVQSVTTPSSPLSISFSYSFSLSLPFLMHAEHCRPVTTPCGTA